jgi:hypothetical protein
MSLLPIALIILINSSTVEYLTCRTIFLMRVAVAIAALRDPTICRRRIEVTSASTNLEFGSVVMDYCELRPGVRKRNTHHGLEGRLMDAYFENRWRYAVGRMVTVEGESKEVYKAKFNFSRVEVGSVSAVWHIHSCI